MAKLDRKERHLMRQRGAGARSLMPTFAFSFGTASAKPQTQQLKTPARRTPSRVRDNVKPSKIEATSPLLMQSIQRSGHIAINASVSRRPTVRTSVPSTPSTRRRSGANVASESARNRTRTSLGRCSTGRRSAGRRISAFATLAADAASTRIKPGRKAKFREHLDDSPRLAICDVPAAEEVEGPQELEPETKGKKEKKATRRKRKPVTMPRSRKASTRKAPVRSTVPDLGAPVDPADLADTDDEDKLHRTASQGPKKRKSDAMMNENVDKRPCNEKSHESFDPLATLQKKPRLTTTLTGSKHSGQAGQTLKGRFQKLRSTLAPTSGNSSRVPPVPNATGTKETAVATTAKEKRAKEKRAKESSLDDRIASWTAEGGDAPGLELRSSRRAVPAKGIVVWQADSGEEKLSTKPATAVSGGKRKKVVAGDNGSDGEGGSNWFTRRGRKKG